MTYVKRHPVSKETRKKISNSNKGKRWSDERKHNFSLLCKSRATSPEARRKLSLAGLAGKGHHIVSEKQRREISQAMKGHEVSIETRRVLSLKAKSQGERNYAIKDSDKDKIIQSYTVNFLSVNKLTKLFGYTGWRIKELLEMRQVELRSKSEEIGIAARRVWRELPKVERDKRINRWINAGKRAGTLPNKSEIYLWGIIEGAVPNEYTYTGWQVSGETVAIGGLRPDFFNIRNQKKVIEFFGGRFHPADISREETENLRKNVYAKFGFRCLIIWEDELKFPVGIGIRIMLFNEQDNEIKQSMLEKIAEVK